MNTGTKNRKKTKNHNDISTSKEVNPQPQKINGFKRFLDWLTSGANELSKGKTACPS